MILHPFQTSDDYKAMRPIHRLSVDLSIAINNVKEGESIIQRRTTHPWDSPDPEVMAAWRALTSPENLADLIQWASEDMNPYARVAGDKAVQVCRERNTINVEQADRGEPPE